MAYAALSIVSPRLNGPAGSGISVNGPLFGILESGAGPYTVLWYNGERVASIIETNLDLIVSGSGVLQAVLVGRQVKITSPSGQDNYGQGTCVAVYNRGGTETALIRNPAGYFIEAAAAQVLAV